MTALELRLLSTLLERRGRVQSRPALLDDVWGMSGEVTTRTVDTHVKRLREKLGSAGPYIETVRGVGYRFTPAPDHARRSRGGDGDNRRAMKLNIRGKLFAVSFGLIIGSRCWRASSTCGRRSRRTCSSASATISSRAWRWSNSAAAEHTDLDRGRLGRAGRRARAARARARHLHRRRRRRARRFGGLAGAISRTSRTTATAPRSRRRWRARSSPSTRYSATVHETADVRGGPAVAARRRARAWPAWPCRSTRSTPRSQAVRHICGRRCGLALVVALVRSSAAAQMLSRALGRMTEAAHAGWPPAISRCARARPAPTRSPSWDARSTPMAGEPRRHADRAARRARSAGGDPAVDAGGGAGARSRKAACCSSTRRCARRFSTRRRRRGAGGAGADPQRGAAVDPGARAQAASGPITGEIETTGPKPRRLLVHAASLPHGQRQAAGAAGGVRRRQRDPAAGDAAQGLRGQRLARAAHADHRGPLGRRHAAPDAGAGSGARPIASSTSSTATPSASARWSRICSICRASSPRSTGPSRRRCRCASSPTRC